MIRQLNVPPGRLFKGPEHATFGWNDLLKECSVWYDDDYHDPLETYYIIVATDQHYDHVVELVSSCIRPANDGHPAIAYHLCRLV